MTTRHPRWQASGRVRPSTGAAAALVALLVWVLGGASWWPPLVGLAVVVVLRLAGPVLPRLVRSHVGLVAAVGAVAAGASLMRPWAWPLLLGVLLAGVAAARPSWLTERPRRVWLGTWAAAGALVLGGLAGAVVDHVQALGRAQADALAAGDYSRAQMLPRSPRAAVSELMAGISDPSKAGRICHEFTDQAARQFADTASAPSCPDAMHQFHDQITAPDVWRLGPTSIPQTLTPDAENGTADGCSMSWTDESPLSLRPVLLGDPGPRLGFLDLRRELGQGYRIVGYHGC